MHTRIVPVLVATMMVTGCGGDGDGNGLSVQAACDGLAETLCERFYACLTPAEIAAIGYPPTEAGCVTERKTEYGCADVTEENTCDPNETYHGAKASTCLDQFGSLECSQIRQPGFDFETAAPACGEICTVE